MRSLSMALLFCAVAALTAGCTVKEEAASGVTVRVATTVAPVAGFVEKVGGARVHVTLMVPPGANPHTYEPRPSQLKEVSRADLYVKVGSGVDFEVVWLGRLLAMNPGLPVVDASAGVRLISDEGAGRGAHAGADPHIWLSPRNAAVMAENIFRGLAAADPGGREYFRANLERFRGELEALDRELRALLAGKEGRKVVVYHPAWTYFTEEYGLVQVPVERGGREPTPGSIAGLIKEARMEGVEVILASPEFSTRSAELIARETGARVVLVSPLDRDYFANMRGIASAFAGPPPR